jgi:hypothetical protein
MLPAPIFTLSAHGKGLYSVTVTVTVRERKEQFTSQDFRSKRKAHSEAARLAIKWIERSGELLTAPPLKQVAVPKECHTNVVPLPIFRGISGAVENGNRVPASAIDRLKGRSLT